MNNITNLKLTLQQIKDNNYKVPTDIDITELITEMLNHIGDPDPLLRDDLIYSILAHWMINNDIAGDILKGVLDVVIDENHLFYRIGEKNTDSVFTRSFSVLLIAPILYCHRKQALFNEDEIKRIYDRITRYFLEEADLRGYTDDRGWAHSVAHTADTLDELAMCSEIGNKELLYILEIIQAKISVGDYVYINEEDERLVTAVISVLDRNLLSSDDVSRWIKGFDDIKYTGSYMDDYKRKLNIKNFLRSMYFRILNKKDMKDILEELEDTLNKMSRYH
ncbi:DUF2785 domain-containing protein [Mobilitalea sibirica]|uniref:DUF2785 domain-containing protein n=1 Tax=Mobilitalea sibirica TaxID=1462919 RepID=A0A8J7H6L7_9FIRM|nr:DUF2785 domain-containing protein [Mobilitalea sibirica]MBH1940651.1 DUF2785 domain-containing protein [Mobilitalea sibirica]